MFNTLLIFLFAIIINQNFLCNKAQENQNQQKFRLGDDVLIEDKLPLLKDKRVAVITNQTGIMSNSVHIIDALVKNNINVVKIFSPEHGIRGDENYSDIDVTGIPIVSIYGDKKAPSQFDLSDVDIVIYDIQDVGARFYTYTSTLKYSMQEIFKAGKWLYVCDRPMMPNANYVDGFMLESGYESFVGSIPTPVCYGMTCGELANYLSLSMGTGLVKVITMDAYKRTTDFNSLPVQWIKPSPSIYTSSSAVCYAATCFLEGTNVSEGRGSEKPFEYFGAPWVDKEQLANELNSYNLNGVTFEAITFTPSEKISAYPPKFFGKECNGIFINVTDKYKFEAVKCGVAILTALKKLCPEFKFNKDNFIDKLAGTDQLRKMINSGSDYTSIIASWKNDLKMFKEQRQKFLYY